MNPPTSPTRSKRLAAGRARALGLATRGTTAPNRLRRVDRWLAGTCAPLLRAAPDPLVVDLGYGATPVTTVELASRLRAVRPDLRVVGLEIDPERVAAARGAAAEGLEFRRGGFELAGLRPAVVRAMNVLRQYDEPAALAAWETLRAGLAPGGLLVEGTCDELGRISSWVALDASGPLTLTLSAAVASLDSPATLAERLPKALIHHNVPGRRIHAFVGALTAAWDTAAPVGTFGPRQRWAAAAGRLAADGWPIVGGRERWRLGELTVAWEAVAD
ncbi:MAG TPA: class I SAM-dependent methyltransferase [Mycobacteriales bacterium]|nr:class I SAM-dependent methyltransferase [Mycobacteriales bacterium]